jgi:glutamyl-Q tRNA(Asp) synthetase
LHFGSLVAAVASYLDARHHDGTWLLRIEDLDPPREKKGAADDILRTLETFGFEWDECVERQSRRSDRYAAIVDDLMRDGAAYACTCSRREIAMIAPAGTQGPVYPGTCRTGPRKHAGLTAIRVLTHARPIPFDDRIQGPCTQQVQRDVGDFVIRRADGLFSYQLAVVADDAAQQITHVVRGADLLLSTPRQIHLQSLLRLPQPCYAHIPVVLDAAGRKLSKSDAAHPVDSRRPLDSLRAALAFLGQPPPETGDVREFWDAAVSAWILDKVPRPMQAGYTSPPGNHPRRT